MATMPASFPYMPERRMFRWDLTIDVPPKQQADTRTWLESRATPYGHYPDTLPDVGPWAAGFARAAIEAVLDLRDKRQLERWMLPQLFNAFKHLSFREEGDEETRTACIPVTWRASEPSPGKVEASIVIRGAARCYAVALRLQEFKGRWMTTALEIA